MVTSKLSYKKTLALFLPGIFLLGFNIGTGSVTTMAKAGADYGMTLLWSVLISCIATYVMIVTYGRYTLITGETALQAFRKHIHPLVGIFFIIALTAGVSGSVMGVMGIVADVSYEWSKGFIEGGIRPLYWALLFISLVYLIFWRGRTDVFERALAVIVAIMAASFVVNFFILIPPPGDILKGLIPSVPDVAETAGRGPLLLIASMVGTTLFSGLFIIRTTLVKEAGWTLKDDRQQKRDALFAAAMMFIISAAIMAAAAGSLHANGLGLNKPAEMVGLLEPLAGPLAVSIFVVGIIAAGVSSQFPNILMLSWLLCDYQNSEREMTLPKYRIMVFIISLLGLVVPLFNARPIFVMIASQAFNVVLLPVTVACIFYLGNKKDIMGDHAHGLGINMALGAIFLFSLITSYMAFQGLLGILESLR